MNLSLFVKKLILQLCLVWLLVGCGRIITPTPSPIAGAVITPSVTPTLYTATPRPRPTPRLASPQTPAIPTITPTPILYTVQSGDTLLKIATSFSTTMETIQAANGLVDPRFLEIGQTLIIPPPKHDTGDPPTPTPTPLPLNV